MSDELPPVRCDDESTWRHKGEKIDLPRLLELIEENGVPEGLDLHGADLSELDASPDALAERAAALGTERPWSPIVTGRTHPGPGPRPPALQLALSDAHLEWATLADAQLQNAFLMGTHLQHTRLWRTDLRRAYLASAHLQQADLRGAQLQDAQLPLADLEDADVRASLDNAYLFRAHLQNTNLRFAELQGASLQEAHGRNTRLEEAHLQNADLWDARLTSAFWYSAHLDRTRMRRDALGAAIGDELAAKGMAYPEAKPLTIDRPQAGFHRAREAYLVLKSNFDSIGRYGDASWAHVKEQQMEKAIHFPTTAGHKWVRSELRRGARHWRRKNPSRLRRFVRASVLGRLRWACLHLRLFVGLCPREVKQKMARRDDHERERVEWLSRWPWARNWAYELLTGYGERPILPLVWAAGLSALFFPLVYWAIGGLKGHSRGFTSSSPSEIDWAGWGDSVIFSLTSFGTLSFTDLQPDGTWPAFVAAVEAFTGVLLFALFIFTLGNRMSRS